MRATHSFPVAIAALFASSIVQAQTPYEVKTPPLTTDWTYTVGTDPWPEYPRPQLRRDRWQSLNGIWTWRAASGDGDVDSPPEAGPLDTEVLIPSCIESGLSGLQVLDVHHMWFETVFEVESDWEGQRILLNFEAVDYSATVFVNGERLANHIGGYARFTVDVTDNVNFGAQNTMLVFVADPTDSQNIPIGKQTNAPSHIFYRPCSGIWQSVWLEPVPEDHITRLDVAANADGQVTVNVLTSASSGAPVEITVLGDDGAELATGSGTADEEFTFTVENPKLWWPETPNLYDIKVQLGESDSIDSYTGFRTISKGEVEGVVRHLLNGEFVFQFGTLDQGYWPDGLHTPPNREAMVYDLEILKDLGFNMVRKHIKIEPDLFYEACDKLGILVIQDMPCLPPPAQPNEAEQAEFRRQLEIMVNEHKSYPSIYSWVIFNEGWGQLDDAAPEELLTQVVRDLDPSRLINSVSGWDDHGFGDYFDTHSYPAPNCGVPTFSSSQGRAAYDPERIALQGEYGGIGHNVTIENLWNVKQAIDQIDETYELVPDIPAWNARTMELLGQVRDHTEQYACSGAVYTQTTDVEGEVNGLVTYDRRLYRPNKEEWRAGIRSLYEAAASRGGRPPTE